MDAILEEAGSCGKFQTIHIILTQLPRMVGFWVQSLMVFGNYKPSWQCRPIPAVQDFGSWASSDNGTGPGTQYTSPWNRNSTLSSSTSSSEVGSFNKTCSSLNTSLCSGDIQFDPGSSTIVSEFELICDKDWVPRTLISVAMLGKFFGSLLGGQLGESFGRRVGLYLSTGLMSVACGLSVLSVSWEMYAVLLFFAEIGDGAIMVLSLVHGVEFLNSFWRGIFGAIPFWSFGVVLFSLMVFILKDWRYINTITALAGLLSILGVFYVPESVRWLVVHGKTRQAEKVVHKIATTNNKPIPNRDVWIQLNEVKTNTPDSDSSAETKASYLDLFRTRKLAFITVRLGVVWVFMVMSYFAMNYGLSTLSGDFFVNFLVGSLVEIPPILSTGYLANVFGRKKTTSLLMTVAGCCCLASALCKFLDLKGVASTVLVFIAKGCTFAAWCAFTTLALETFPTVVRSVGFGLLSTISKVGGVLCPLLIPETQSEFVVYYVIISCGLLLSILVVMSMKETKDREMEDVIGRGEEEEEEEGNKEEEEEGNEGVEEEEEED